MSIKTIPVDIIFNANPDPNAPAYDVSLAVAEEIAKIGNSMQIHIPYPDELAPVRDAVNGLYSGAGIDTSSGANAQAGINNLTEQEAKDLLLQVGGAVFFS